MKKYWQNKKVLIVVTEMQKQHIEKQQVERKMEFNASKQTPSKSGKRTGTSVECDLCGKTLCNKDSLSRHIRTHTGEKPYPCTQCVQKFAEKGNLRRHIASVHNGEKPHECTQCGQRFALKGTLSSHITSIHRGEKPYKCKQCGQRFAEKGNLSRHITSIHTGEKHHECTQCGQRFPPHNIDTHWRKTLQMQTVWTEICT